MPRPPKCHLRLPGPEDALTEQQVKRYLSYLTPQDQEVVREPGFTSLARQEFEQTVANAVLACLWDVAPKLRSAMEAELAKPGAVPILLEAYGASKAKVPGSTMEWLSCCEGHFGSIASVPGPSLQDFPDFVRFCLAYRIHCYFNPIASNTNSIAGSSPSMKSKGCFSLMEPPCSGPRGLQLVFSTTDIASQVLQGYGLMSTSPIAVRCLASCDLDIAETISAALQIYGLPCRALASGEPELDELTIWLLTPGQEEQESQEAAKELFQPGRALLLHTADIRVDSWAADLPNEVGSSRPIVEAALSRNALSKVSVEDLELTESTWVAELWSELMRLQGVTSSSSAVELYESITSAAGLKERRPHLVAIASPSRRDVAWTPQLLKSFVQELVRLRYFEAEQEVILLTTGFRSMESRGNEEGQSAAYLAALQFSRYGGKVVHVLPEVALETSHSDFADQLRNGTFLPVDCGSTVFAGRSATERLELLAEVCDLVFLLEGGEEVTAFTKALQREECRAAVVPLLATGGDLPALAARIKQPAYVTNEFWDMLADGSVQAEEVVSDAQVQGIAQAMASIVWNTMHPLQSTTELSPNFQCQPTPWKDPARCLRQQLGDCPIVSVLGARTALHPSTRGLLEAIAQELDRLAPSVGGMIFMTASLPGVQQIFAEGLRKTSRLYNLGGLVSGSTYRAGECWPYSEDDYERRQLLCRLGDIFITAEGGLGLVHDAQLIQSRGAAIVPLARTGGASSGHWAFPKECLAQPAVVAAADWELLFDPSASVEVTAAAVARAVAALVRARRGLPPSAPKDFQIGPWQLPADRFVAPSELLEQEWSLAPLGQLLKLCDKGLRIHGRWPSGHDARLAGLLESFMADYKSRYREPAQLSLLQNACSALSDQPMKRCFTILLEEVVRREPAFNKFVSFASDKAQQLVELPDAENVRQVAHPHCVSQLLEMYSQAHAALPRLEHFCGRIASRSSTRVLARASLRPFLESLEVALWRSSPELEDPPRELQVVAGATLEGNMNNLFEALSFIWQDADVRLLHIKDSFGSMDVAGCKVVFRFRHCSREPSPSPRFEIRLVHRQLTSLMALESGVEAVRARVAASLMGQLSKS